MSYEYVSKTKRDAVESTRVIDELVRRGIKPVVVMWKPETNSIVVYFNEQLSSEDKEKLDKIMKDLGYMVG